MNSHDFTGCNIRQKSRLVANPVDVHLFTRLAIYRHWNFCATIVFLNKTLIVFIELRFFISIWILFFVVQPTEWNIYSTVWGMNTIIVILKIWKWNFFALKIFLWVKEVLYFFWWHSLKLVNGEHDQVKSAWSDSKTIHNRSGWALIQTHLNSTNNSVVVLHKNASFRNLKIMTTKKL